MNVLARKMRRHRFDNGSLYFRNRQHRFEINKDGTGIHAMHAEKAKRSNHLVEEFMLLANRLVAETLIRKHPQFAILRRHEPPIRKTEGVLGFLSGQDRCRDVNLKFQFSSKGDLGAFYGAYNELVRSRRLNRAGRFSFNLKMLQTMNAAEYFRVKDGKNIPGWHHFGLGFDAYTHFTSPIRRYVDIMVHRLVDCICIKSSIHRSSKERTNTCMSITTLTRY